MSYSRPEIWQCALPWPKSSLSFRSPEISDNYIHFQVYGLNDIFRQTIRSVVPSWFRERPILNAIGDRFYLVQGFLHSSDSSHLQLTITSSQSTRDEIHVRGVINPALNTRGEASSSTFATKSSRFRQSFHRRNPTMVAPGRSFHAGGSFPMGSKNTLYCSDLLGPAAGLSWTSPSGCKHVSEHSRYDYHLHCDGKCRQGNKRNIQEWLSSVERILIAMVADNAPACGISANSPAKRICRRRPHANTVANVNRAQIELLCTAAMRVVCFRLQPTKEVESYAPVDRPRSRNPFCFSLCALRRRSCGAAVPSRCRAPQLCARNATPASATPLGQEHPGAGAAAAGASMGNFGVTRNALLAVLCFCLTASAGYIINDLIDVEVDRKHATKRLRPLVAGRS